ncbi:MAG: NAD(P)-dependent oxidoreductase [Lachnospiraceae bacterium]|nr:NAD(P)-dependent oxidoreductase [Lachnospiraceae bacterium]
MKRAIVTGATGTIGVALVKVLLEADLEVLAIVNPLSTRVDRLPEHEHLHIMKHSIHDISNIQKDEIGAYDAFFHLAWTGTIGPERDDMSLQLRNVQDTLDAVDLAARVGCQVFVGAGSQAEYGRVEGKIQGSTPANPEMGYGIAKLCAGQMSRVLCQRYEMRHIWTRILSVYGPYDGEKTMIISGIRQMLRGETPEFSRGEQLWDYLYCEDAARAIYMAGVKGRDGATYPIGSGKARPLHEYIEIMRRTVGKQARVNMGALPYRPQQVMYLCADIEELSKDTGFLPKIAFDEGIRHTVEWCRRTQE